MVVHAADADRVSVLRHGLRHRAGAADVHGLHRRLRNQPIDMRCLDTMARYLFYTFVIDFSLEMLDLIHRIYEAGESFQTPRLHGSYAAVSLADRAADRDSARLVPLALAGGDAGVPPCASRGGRLLYAVSGALTLIGIFAMRWNVVIGGQLFSKSFLGYTTYKMGFATREGLLPAIFLMILPFFILWGLDQVSAAMDNRGVRTAGGPPWRSIVMSWPPGSETEPGNFRSSAACGRARSSATVEPSPPQWNRSPQCRDAPARLMRSRMNPVEVDNFAPLFGWAFLGIAGAYLLPGITESGTIPGLLGAALGVVYAGWWLYLASRRAWERPLFSTVHGLTAAL